MKCYVGHYGEMEEHIESNSLIYVQACIEKEWGDNFLDYETAWIMEYNFMGRHSAQHYFSIKDKKWHRTKRSIIIYSSWDYAIEPFRTIAQYFIKKLGYLKKQQEATKKWIEERDKKITT